MLGEQKILVYASPLDSIQIAYLVAASESAASGWYIFREAEQTFVPYTPIPVAPSTFVILNPPVGENAPFGFIPTTMTVGEMTVEAYQSEGSAESDIYLVYAMAQDGNCNYYFYDSKNVSFSSYFAHSVEPEENSELVNAQVSGRLEEIRAIADRMEILSLILALVIVFMGIGMVLLLAFYRRAPKGKRKKKTESVDPMGELLLVENEFNRDAKENISIDKIYETEQKKD